MDEEISCSDMRSHRTDAWSRPLNQSSPSSIDTERLIRLKMGKEDQAIRYTTETWAVTFVVPGVIGVVGAAAGAMSVLFVVDA
jgi:hypothetical protein